MDIIAKNNIIAEFMGWVVVPANKITVDNKVIEIPELWLLPNSDGTFKPQLHFPRYDNDYNSMLSIVKKIQSLSDVRSLEFVVEPDSCYDEQLYSNIKNAKPKSRVKISIIFKTETLNFETIHNSLNYALFKSLLDFILWYKDLGDK